MIFIPLSSILKELNGLGREEVEIVKCSFPGGIHTKKGYLDTRHYNSADLEIYHWNSTNSIGTITIRYLFEI